MKITIRPSTKKITATIPTVTPTPVTKSFPTLSVGKVITFTEMKKIYAATFNDKDTLKGVKTKDVDSKTSRYKVLKAYKKLDDHLNGIDLGISQRNYGAAFEVVDIADKIKFSTRKVRNALKRYSKRIN